MKVVHHSSGGPFSDSPRVIYQALIDSGIRVPHVWVGRIGTVVNDINSAQLTIASAIEEQTATTGGLTRNVGETAVGAGDIAASISDVARTAQRTTVAATDTARPRRR